MQADQPLIVMRARERTMIIVEVNRMQRQRRCTINYTISIASPNE
jgi:hypothetical protein